MKTLRTLLAAVLAAVSVVSAFAAETTPAGSWKWTANGPQGPIEVTARLEFKDGKVTGVIAARDTETAIQPGTFKDGQIDFVVIREMHGMQFEVKYSGKLDGDTLTGTIDRPLPGGERQVVDWKATRAR